MLLWIINTHICDDTIQFLFRYFLVNLYQNLSKPQNCDIALAPRVKQPGSVDDSKDMSLFITHLKACLSSSMVSSLARTSSSASPEPSGYFLPGPGSLCSAGIAIDYWSGCYLRGRSQLIDTDPCIKSQVLSVNSVSAYIVNLSCQAMSCGKCLPFAYYCFKH